MASKDSKARVYFCRKGALCPLVGPWKVERRNASRYAWIIAMAWAYQLNRKWIEECHDANRT